MNRMIIHVYSVTDNSNRFDLVQLNFMYKEPITSQILRMCGAWGDRGTVTSLHFIWLQTRCTKEDINPKWLLLKMVLKVLISSCVMITLL